SYDELIAGYYGRHHRKHHHDHHHPGHDRDGHGQGETPGAVIGCDGGTARVLSLTRDDGEILTQSRGHDHGDPVGGDWDDVDNRFERHHHPEYVVDMPSSALSAASPAAAAPPSPAPAAPPPAPSAAAPAEP